jgi:hypothetical protein
VQQFGAAADRPTNLRLIVGLIDRGKIAGDDSDIWITAATQSSPSE